MNEFLANYDQAAIRRDSVVLLAQQLETLDFPGSRKEIFSPVATRTLQRAIKLNDEVLKHLGINIDPIEYARALNEVVIASNAGIDPSGAVKDIVQSTMTDNYE